VHQPLPTLEMVAVQAVTTRLALHVLQLLQQGMRFLTLAVAVVPAVTTLQGLPV